MVDMSQPGAGISPEEALRLLIAGHERFISGVCFYPPIGADRRSEVVNNGQHPYATFISCSDSRVPLEILFNAGIGDLFVIRIGGNICTTNEIGTAEFSVRHIGTPLCVVLGHTHCKAVTVALTGMEMQGSIPLLLAPLLPVVEQVRSENPGVATEDLVCLAVVANVWRSVEQLLTHSAEISQAVTAGRVQVIGAVYDVISGGVEWLGPHPRQEQLLG
jgi:carbonic anhydrase